MNPKSYSPLGADMAYDDPDVKSIIKEYGIYTLIACIVMMLILGVVFSLYPFIVNN